MKDQRDTLSAWNWQSGHFDYYAPPLWAKKPYGDTETPKPARVTGQLGEAPEDSAASMPFGARYLGSGDEARGQIVQHPREGGAVLQQYAAPAIVGALVGYHMTKHTKGALYGAGGGVIATLLVGFMRNAAGVESSRQGLLMQSAAGAAGSAALLSLVKP